MKKQEEEKEGMCDHPGRYSCGCVNRGALLWGACERWMCDKIWGSVTKYKMAGDMANRKPVKLGVCDVSWRGGKRRG